MIDTPTDSTTQNITITTNLLAVPEYAALLGHLCAAWANLEWQMYLVFEQMCGAPHAIARSAFYALESNRGKREMVLAVSKTVLEKQADRSVLEDILRRIGRTAGQRNRYVHDTWCVASTQKQEVFQLRLSNAESERRDMDEVKTDDLTAATAQIQKLSEELNAFRNRVAGALPALLEKLRARPGLALVYAKKGHNPGKLPKGHHGPKPPSRPK